MSEDQVYVSINSKEHKENRSQILMAQADILHILKKISKIERIQREKDIYKTKLIRQYKSLLKEINKLEDKMPDPEIPRGYKKKKVEEEIEEEIEEIFQDEGIDINAVENELMAVQEQLKRLNG